MSALRRFSRVASNGGPGGTIGPINWVRSGDLAPEMREFSRLVFDLLEQDKPNYTVEVLRQKTRRERAIDDDTVTLMAVGWLAAEGHYRAAVHDHEVTPETAAGRETLLREKYYIESRGDFPFRMPDEIAIKYGMVARLVTAGTDVDPSTFEGSIGTRSCAILQFIAKETEPVTFKDLAREVSTYVTTHEPPRMPELSKLLANCEPRERLVTAMAFGWLAEQRRYPRSLFGIEVEPNFGVISPRERELVENSSAIEVAAASSFAMDWGPSTDVTLYGQYKSALIKAFAHGMWMRRRHANDNHPENYLDVAARAITVQNMLPRDLSHIRPFSLDGIKLFLGAAEGGKPDAGLTEFMVAAGLGWLATEGDLFIGVGDDLSFKLKFGRKIEGDWSLELPAHAENILAHIVAAGRVIRLDDLPAEHLGKENTALAVGYLARQERLRVEASGKHIVLEAAK